MKTAAVSGTCSSFLLARARSGAWTLKVRADNGCEKAIHSLYDPQREAGAIVDSLDWDGRGMMVVVGLGLGYHVAALSARFPSSRIVVVEAQKECVELAAEYGPALNEHVLILGGMDRDEALGNIRRLQLRSGMPALSILALAPSVSAFPSYYPELLAELKRSSQARVTERLKYPKFRADRAHIGLLDFGYYLLPELERAIDGLGHRCSKIPVRKGQEGEAAVCLLMERLVESRPDFLLTINHLGFDQQGILTSFLESIELPVASWFVDSPNLIIKGFNANLSPLVSIFLWDQGYLQDMRDMGFRHVLYLPLAADETVFKPLRLSKSEWRDYGADAGFVGNSMLEPAQRWLERIPRERRPVVEELATTMSAGRISLDAALHRTGRAADFDSLIESEKLDMEGAALWRATLLYRLGCVSALAEFRHRICGDDGWRQLLGSNFRTFRRLGYYSELPRFYNACGVNLNATSLQMGSAVNQRVFDVPACESFILTDYQDSLAELFEPGEECVAYREAGEIADLTRHYLKRPAEARAIARRGRERVLKQHTYKHRLQSIVRHMTETYGNTL